jgi:hypothetical protein
VGRAIDVGTEALHLLVAGCVGPAAAHEFLTWVGTLQLPDPDELLADPDAAAFTGMRGDRVFAVLQAVLSAVVADCTPERWTAAVEVCAAAAEVAGVDPAVPVVRALMRAELRPAGAVLPQAILTFRAPLALAGLLGTEAA